MWTDFDTTHARAEYYHLDDVLDPETGDTPAAAVETQRGTNQALLLLVLVSPRSVSGSSIAPLAVSAPIGGAGIHPRSDASNLVTAAQAG